MNTKKYFRYFIFFLLIIFCISVFIITGCSKYSLQKSAEFRISSSTENTLKPAKTSMVQTTEKTTDSAGSETTSPPYAKEIIIINDSFQPSEITIKIHEAVKWINKDDHAHTVASSTGVFNSGIITSSGGQFSFTFDKEGTYDYICEIHPGMTGKITVLK
jgi:plastocyanin